MKMVLNILGFFAGLAGSLCGTLSTITFGAWLLKLCVPALFVGSGFATYPLGMLALKFTLAGIGLGILSIASIGLGSAESQDQEKYRYHGTVTPATAAIMRNQLSQLHTVPLNHRAKAFEPWEQSQRYTTASRI